MSGPSNLPASVKMPGTAIMQKYLDRAVGILERMGVLPDGDTTAELNTLLEEVRHVDEPKVLAIMKTTKYMSAFNAMVRENVANIKVGNRYIEITQLFDSIRDDAKRLIEQLADGKISMVEKFSNLWMWLFRGSPNARFEDILTTYKDVSRDTNDQLEREQTIMEGYIDFRFALKEAEVHARDLVELQIPILENAKEELAAAQKLIDDYTGDDETEMSKMELVRDETRREFEKQDRNYQLCKDITENLSIGYDVGETLITKLKQTHDVKDQLYRKAVTFFTTNEHVFTILGTVYSSQAGLFEATQATEAMKEGVNKGLEDVAELGRDLERAALKAGYGSTVSAASVEKLVAAISDYQVESLHMIADLRKESEENAREIRRVVEQGKQQYQRTLAKFAIDGFIAAPQAEPVAIEASE
jgi:hypothetical protein